MLLMARYVELQDTQLNTMPTFGMYSSGLGVFWVIERADTLATAIVQKLWNEKEGRFYQGFKDGSYALDTTSWGSIFLSATGETDKARRSAQNAEAYRHMSVRVTGYDCCMAVGTVGVALAMVAVRYRQYLSRCR